MSNERRYRVRWEIDIEADSPREAAEKAREIQTNPESMATVFQVIQIHDYTDGTCTPGEPIHIDTAAVECECGEIVAPNDPYFATPCGTHCEACFEKHRAECEVCDKEF